MQGKRKRAEVFQIFYVGKKKEAHQFKTQLAVASLLKTI